MRTALTTRRSFNTLDSTSSLQGAATKPKRDLNKPLKTASKVEEMMKITEDVKEKMRNKYSLAGRKSVGQVGASGHAVRMKEVVGSNNFGYA